MATTLTNYDIDLSRVYENMPNQDWGRNSQNTRDRALFSIHHNITRDLTERIWRAVNNNVGKSHDVGGLGWTNLNFFISGKRGSGKSTFLRHITHALISGDFGPNADAPAVSRPSIHKLFFCDPTAMTSKENFLVSVVGAFYKIVMTAGTQQGNGFCRISGGGHSHAEEGTGMHSHELHFHAPSNVCKELIEEMARGIKLLDAESSTEKGLDSITQLKQGFINSTRAMELKGLFDRMVDTIAKEYDYDAFLIAIDDADIDGTENRQIMETIRKYLTHPRIIILYTCDMLLANETIREKHFVQFDRDFHHADHKYESRRWRLVGEMTAQYIKKIFPSSNHIELESLLNLINESENDPFGDRYNVVFHDAGGTKRYKVGLMELIQSVFAVTVTRNADEARSFAKIFFMQPLRSILTILRYWNDNGFARFLRANGEDSYCFDKSRLRYANKDLSKKLHKMLADSFRITNLDELLDEGFTTNEINSTSCYQLCRGLLRHCINCKNVSNGYYLANPAAQYSHQEATLMLATKAAGSLRNFGDSMMYMLFGVFSIQAYACFEHYALSNADVFHALTLGSAGEYQKSQYIRNAFMQYLFAGDNDDIKHWANKISVLFLCLRPDVSESPDQAFHLYNGVYLFTKNSDVDFINATMNFLLAMEDGEDDGDDDEVVEDSGDDGEAADGDAAGSGGAETPDGESGDEEDDDDEDEEDGGGRRDRVRAYFLIRILLGQVSDMQNTYYLSVYNLFGFIASCYAHACESEDKKKAIRQLVRSTISGGIPTCATPVWSGKSAISSSGKAVKINSDGMVLDTEVEELVEEIAEWCEAFSSYRQEPLSSLNQQADALFSDITNICNEIMASVYDARLDDRGVSSELEIAAACALNYFSPKLPDGGQKLSGVGAYIRNFPVMRNLHESLLCICKVFAAARETVNQEMEYRNKLRELNASIERMKREISKRKEDIRAFFLKGDSSVGSRFSLDLSDISADGNERFFAACSDIIRIKKEMESEISNIEPEAKKYEDDDFALDHNIPLEMYIQVLSYQLMERVKELKQKKDELVDFTGGELSERMVQILNRVDQKLQNALMGKGRDISYAKKELDKIGDIDKESLTLSFIKSIGGRLALIHRDATQAQKQGNEEIRDVYDIVDAIKSHEAFQECVSLFYNKKQKNRQNDLIQRITEKSVEEYDFNATYQKMDKVFSLHANNIGAALQEHFQRFSQRLEQELALPDSGAEPQMTSLRLLQEIDDMEKTITGIFDRLSLVDTSRGMHLRYLSLNNDFVSDYGLTPCFRDINRRLSYLRLQCHHVLAGKNEQPAHDDE